MDHRIDEFAGWTVVHLSGELDYHGTPTIRDLMLERIRAGRDMLVDLAVCTALQGKLETARELNARANRLAHRLRSVGVGPEVVVGIRMERSAEALVAILGVLKAGGAYLPLEPGQPAKRLSFQLADSGARVLLTDVGGIESPARVMHVGQHGADLADETTPVAGR